MEKTEDIPWACLSLKIPLFVEGKPREKSSTRESARAVRLSFRVIGQSHCKDPGLQRHSAASRLGTGLRTSVGHLGEAGFPIPLLSSKRENQGSLDSPASS